MKRYCETERACPIDENFDIGADTGTPVDDKDYQVPSSPAAEERQGRNHMIDILTELPAHTVGFKMSGKLHDEDYKKFVPLVDAEIAKQGKVNILAQFHDFHGWDAKALWDDIKFSTTHCTQIKRIALVGEKTWEKWMATVCRPFTMARIRYFDAAEMNAAKAWLAEEA